MHVYLAWAAKSSELPGVEGEGGFLTWTFGCLPKVGACMVLR